MNEKKCLDAYRRMNAYLAKHQPKTTVLFSYMAARAIYEGKEHTLTLGWYESQFWIGVRTFFNVLLDDDGNLMTDTENTAFWKQYQGFVKDCES